MRIAAFLLAFLALLAVANAEIFYKETFDKDWKDRWVVSNWKKSSGEAGAWKHTAGEWYGNKDEDAGLQTSQDARFYAISSKTPKPFTNEGKDLIVQFQIRFPQKIDCGGGYIKLLPSTTDQENFNGDSPYYIMFGPDVCGTSTKRVHVILNYKGENKLIKKDVRCEDDQLSHVYTLILRPDQTYEVRIDGTKKESGSLLDDWEFLAPKTIKDPSVSKPSEWVDEPLMDDPEDQKPSDWENTPKQIPDPEAQKPDDWDDEADGEWEAPLIDNPEYKGAWKAKKIPNPSYKGAWKHPEIDNPKFVADDKIYAFSDIGAVGIEIWQVKAGTIFDNIIVTDNEEEAEDFMSSTFGKNKAGEKSMFEEAEKKKRDKEEEDRKKSDEERKRKESEEEEDEDDDEPEDKDEL
jgi:calreticulin